MLAINFNDVFKDSFISSFTNEVSISTIVITLVFSFILSMFVYLMYKLTSKNIIYSKKFNATMSLMSIITSAIVLSMQSNITVSLGMVGALSIVRFRTAIKEPRDLLFLFWSISNGIIIGSQIYSLALVLALVLSIAMLFYDLLPEKAMGSLLVIYYSGNLNIDNILKKHKIKYKLKSMNLTTKESNNIYEVKIKGNNDFIKEISKIKNVSEVNLLSQDGESQY